MKLFLGAKWRRWSLIAGLAGLAFGVWLWLDYMPAASEKSALEARLETLRTKEAALRKQLAKLQQELAQGGLAAQDVRRIERMLVEARSLEEVGSKMQQMLQEVFEKNGVTVQSYSVLGPSSWEGIPMALTEFRLNVTPEGLASVLRFLESEEKLVRVERLSLVYRGTQGPSLFVTLRVGTLFVDVENLKRYVSTDG